MKRQGVAKIQKMPTDNTRPHRQSARSSSAGHRLLELQRSVGNHAIQRLIHSPHIQTKLQISKPGDPLEQEADRTADRVMRMEEPAMSSDASAHITPLVQRDSKKPEDEEETMVSRKSHGVPLAVREDDDDEEKVQRACNDCEEETVNRKETDEEEEGISRSAVTPHAPAPASANIRAMQGGGSPLPPATRAFFEPRFGADFSGVRVHTDQRAADTAKSLNARAFTVGRDIAFGAGQNSFESHEGRRLLAHELTHVVQQKPEVSSERIQRDDQPGVDAPKGPKELLEERLEDYDIEEDENLTSKEKAEMRRAGLLLMSEIDLLDHPDHAAAVLAQYTDLNEYVADTINGIHATAGDETQTIDRLIAEKGLSINTADFASHPFFTQNLAAFPESFLKIFAPLVKPPYEEGRELLSDAERARRHLDYTRSELPSYFFEDGLPVSRQRSRSLAYYELIKAKKLRSNFMVLLMNRPRWESDLDYVTDPEERKLHAGLFLSYQTAWAGRVINLYNSVVFNIWSGNFVSVKNAIEAGNIGSINANDLRTFKEKHPDGFTSIDDLLRFSGPGVLSGGIGSLQEASPFLFFNFTRAEASLAAARSSADFIEAEYRAFHRQLLMADAKVQGMSDVDRLGKALHWSVKKDFAAEGILAVIDNFGNLLTDILKEKVKKSVFRRIVSFVASLHPLGRLVVLAYEVYKTVEEAKDVLDVVQLIHLTAATIDDARNATSIVEVQRSAARLADVYAEFIPKIAEKLSAGLAKKLLKGRDKKKAPSDPKRPVSKPADDPDRKQMLEESRKVKKVGDLEPKYLNVELDTISKSGLRKSTVPGYEVEATLTNGHTWRRNSKGVWCRFTEPSCILTEKDQPEEIRKELAELNRNAEEYKQAHGTDAPLSQQELDELSKTPSDNPPGFKKPKAKTSLGTFMHSRDYIRFVNWLDTAPGRKWLADQNIKRSDLALQNLPTGKIEREFVIQHPDMPGKPRADIVDWDNATVHEIKPNGLELQGFVEAEQYAEYMNRYHKRSDGKEWRAGHTIAYDGNKILELFTQFGYFEKEGK